MAQECVDAGAGLVGRPELVEGTTSVHTPLGALKREMPNEPLMAKPAAPTQPGLAKF